MNTTFYWNAEKTPAIINSALKMIKNRTGEIVI